MNIEYLIQSLIWLGTGFAAGYGAARSAQTYYRWRQ